MCGRVKRFNILNNGLKHRFAPILRTAVLQTTMSYHFSRFPPLLDFIGKTTPTKQHVMRRKVITFFYHIMDCTHNQIGFRCQRRNATTLPSLFLAVASAVAFWF